MITRPIPSAAYIVVQELVRAKVVLPKASEWRIKSMEIEYLGTTNLIQCLRINKTKCPMGFHPEARVSEPFDGEQLRCRKSKTWDRAIVEFASWWDSQTDAAAALREIRRIAKRFAPKKHARNS